MGYDVGDGETLTAIFLDDDDDPIDPTTVTLIVTNPAGVATTYTGAGLDHPSVGHFEKPVVFNLPGAWQWQWSGVGPPPFSQVEQGAFIVGVGKRDPMPWISAQDIFDGTACSGIVAPELVVADRSARVASYVLWALSGRQFPGVYIDTVRPCRQTFLVGTSWYERAQLGWWNTGNPWGLCGCGQPDQCGCGGLSQVRLPRTGSLLDVLSVKVDGVVLDPSAYRVDEWDRLVRIDGDSWPCCQDLSLADTEDDTWSVTYAYGHEPPEAGRSAARDLACELYHGAMGGDCALPKRVSTITRQGVTVALLDAFNFFDKGRTGIYSVDLFLAAVNPKGRMRRGSIASPDVGPYATRTGT